MAEPRHAKLPAGTDPFYRQIICGLDQTALDANVFEDCVCDLLKDAFPGLVAIRGGLDAGMDGAIADGEAEPFPLVCTTEQNVIGNLTKSLDSYVRSGGARRKVVLATSQALTPPRRRNLEKCAYDKGFTLVQTIEQYDIAERLYQSPRWYKGLLGLSGSPPALSVVPKMRRPLIEIELIGREADVAWLRETSGDRLLVGEPGSGKTYLLRYLVREGWGLFLNSADPTAIANALREQQPKVVIVDDAHSRLEDLETLRHLRDEMGLELDIVATSWKGDRDAVASALGVLETGKIRQLELLTRDQILEIIQQAGVEATDELLRELVDQAANKPGLAVTLAQLWHRGDWREVLTGEALRRSLLPILKQLVDEDAAPILAALGLGGDSGMALNDVAEFLGLDRVKVRRIATGLSAGGVLGETSDGLAVSPRRLRSALLREVFFSGLATAFKYRDLFPRVPDPTSAVAALVEARHSLIDVPIGELRELVEQYGSPAVWRSFAALGKTEATWALENYLKFQPASHSDPRRASEFYPRRLMDIAAEAIERAPEATIPRLLELAAEERPTNLRQSEQTLEYVKRWLKVFPSSPDSPEPLRRRQLLLRLASDFLGNGGERSVGTEALTMVLTPTCEMHSRDPGSGRTTTLKWGLFHEETLGKIEALWPKIHRALGVIDVDAWRPLRRVLWSWLFPEGAAPSAEIRPKHAAQMRTFAARILADLAAQTQGQPGLSAALKRLGKRIDLDLPLEVDPLFELLFPERRGSIDEVQAQSAATDLEIEELAKNWADTGDPRSVAHQLAILERESSYIEHDHLADDNVRDLCIHLAGASVTPEKWFDAFLTVEMPGDITDLFLLRIVKLRRPGWETHVSNAFEIPSLRKQATALMLQDAEAPPHLLERALLEVPRIPEAVERAWGPDLPPLSTVRTLLKSTDQHVALFAACAEWTWKPKGTVREEVWDDWRSAILRSAEIINEDEFNDTIVYDLALIFGKEPALALDWLRIRLRQPDAPSRLFARGLVADATRALTKPQLEQLRRELGEVSQPQR